MQFRRTVDSDFSVLVLRHPAGGIEPFKYRGSELIREASGPDFQSAMLHTTMGGLLPDEPWTTKWFWGGTKRSKMGRVRLS